MQIPLKADATSIMDAERMAWHNDFDGAHRSLSQKILTPLHALTSAKVRSALDMLCTLMAEGVLRIDDNFGVD